MSVTPVMPPWRWDLWASEPMPIREVRMAGMMRVRTFSPSLYFISSRKACTTDRPAMESALSMDTACSTCPSAKTMERSGYRSG